MHPIQEKLLRVASSKNLGPLTLRSIAALIGESSAQKIQHHLSQLEKRGLLRINKNRKIIERVREGGIKNSNLVSVPIVGAANCGPATLLAEEKLEGYLKVSSRLLRKKKGIFAIKAAGPSMNRTNLDGKNIEDGNYLIIDGEARNPHDGDIVVSVIDGMANVKQYRWDPANDRIVLVSNSTKDFPPIYIHKDDDFMINGKVIQVIKRYKDE